MLRIVLPCLALCAVSISSPAFGQALCNQGTFDHVKAVCGFDFRADGRPSCGSVDDAIVAVDWVLFKDAGALATYRAEIAACNYRPTGNQSFFAIVVAQKHNPSAMCNLVSCTYEMIGPMGSYIARLLNERRMPSPK
ncbi:hypothetical protein QN224_29950 [Sinorhizobium sp. 8-89]|uniref:hypothetical protein n=1 Tax=Sinorhizobium sp. 7-81 TaxID=3049087 RepID=UPI0024C3EF1D|nr:hypothetical protein [Sinorhizobium sp. 7-81]MDK1389607.1 hypothetical protein [Sinorhizobium sp. 7-81]